MTTYFITRHKGALDWARWRGIKATHLAHLDVDIIQPKDVVLGTLPISLVAEINQRGARYLHLTIENLPQEKRGQELSAEDMDAFGAKLEEYEARKV